MRARGFIALVLAVASAACGRGGSTDPDVIPNAPTNLSASAIGSGRAQALWTDNSDNEAGFVVEVSQDGVAWADAVIVDADVTSASVPGLVPGVGNELRVRALNVKGRSAEAGPVTVTPAMPSWSGPVTGPQALYWAASAYDSKRRWMLVFGGVDDASNPHNSLYALDLNTTPPVWLSISPINSAPAPRSGASMIYDPDSDRLIVFGGSAGAKVTQEVWEFSLATVVWKNLATNGPLPAPRQHHQAVYDPTAKRMVLCGGENEGTLLFDTPVLNLVSKTNPTWGAFDPIPSPRTRHSAVYDGIGGRLLVFGGADKGLNVFQDVLSLNLSAGHWSSLPTQGTPPTPRLGHLAVWDELNHQMVVVAGADAFEFPIDDLWTLSLGATPTWRALTPGGSTPLPVFYAAGAYDDVSGRLFLFGGTDDFFLGTDETWWLGL